MNATGLSRVALAFLIIGVLIGGVALGRVVTAFDPTTSPTPSAMPSPSSTGTVNGQPDSDVVGEDIRRLPRYPGSIRTEYEVIVDESYRLTITEFMVDAPLELRETDANELLTALPSRAEVLAREHGARLIASLDGSGSLSADTGRIEQAILILVDNAAKYGSPDGEVELDARTVDSRLVVEVRDRGRGIPVEQQTRIFERFYRADGSSRGRSSGGAGLGLPIAAAIIEGHGGRITATDRPGGGTVMSVSLPLASPT